MKELPILHSTFGDIHVHPDKKDYWKCVVVCRFIPMLIILFFTAVCLWVPAPGHEQLKYFRWVGEEVDMCTKDILREDKIPCPR